MGDLFTTQSSPIRIRVFHILPFPPWNSLTALHKRRSGRSCLDKDIIVQISWLETQAKLPICDLPLYGLLLLTSKRARHTGKFVTLLPHDPKNYTLIQSLLLTFLAWVTVNFKISGVPSETLLPSQRDRKGQLSQWFPQTLFARHLFSRNELKSRAHYSFSRLISLLLCDLSDSTVFNEVIQTPDGHLPHDENFWLQNCSRRARCISLFPLKSRAILSSQVQLTLRFASPTLCLVPNSQFSLTLQYQIVSIFTCYTELLLHNNTFSLTAIARDVFEDVARTRSAWHNYPSSISQTPNWKNRSSFKHFIICHPENWL